MLYSNTAHGTARLAETPAPRSFLPPCFSPSLTQSAFQAPSAIAFVVHTSAENYPIQAEVHRPTLVFSSVLFPEHPTIPQQIESRNWSTTAVNLASCPLLPRYRYPTHSFPLIWVAAEFCPSPKQKCKRYIWQAPSFASFGYLVGVDHFPFFQPCRFYL